MNNLTDETIKSFTPKEKSYKRSDGGGMYILVSPNGSKAWKMKYRYKGIERKLSFGMYPFVGIDQARNKRLDAYRLLNEGFDPSATYAEKKVEKISDLSKIRIQQKQLIRLAKNKEASLKIKRDLVINLAEITLDESDIMLQNHLLDGLMSSIEEYWKERQQTLVAELKSR